ATFALATLAAAISSGTRVRPRTSRTRARRCSRRDHCAARRTSTMKSIVTRGIPRSLLALVALGAISGHTLPAGRWQAQTSYGVGGQGYAAVVNLATGTQQFAGAALPAEGGMANADLDNAAVANTFTASTLTSITTGMADSAGASAQTTAEAADVNILNGDRKSTRLNSSHVKISYAVFCL